MTGKGLELEIRMTAREAPFADLLAENYAKLLGKSLVPDGMAGDAAAAWLYEAPFGLLAHDTSPDPVFCYANLAAQERFEYGWDEFVGLPSRLSAAGGEDRETRDTFMDWVRSHGYAENYQGLRVAKSGRQFRIRDVTIWNLANPESAMVGQAALIGSWADA
ncbi:MAG TPA: MEKHLA domain-containing protein [Trebonia sp.]|nr:MEKHLA domain-containing protein [Trebonia sp.]